MDSTLKWRRKRGSRHFVDPTGWIVDLQKLKPILSRRPGEVLFNFMFDHINRFNQTFPKTFDLIFSDAEWRSKLDKTLPPSEAVPALFGEKLKEVGQYKFTAATEVLKATSDRTHFHLFYGTRNINGLCVFRGVQRKAGEEQDTQRNYAKKQQKLNRTGIGELFPEETHFSNPLSIAHYEEELNKASKYFNRLIKQKLKIPYDDLIADMLQRFVITQTDVNNLLRQTKKDGRIDYIGISANELIPKLGKEHFVSSI